MAKIKPPPERKPPRRFVTGSGLGRFTVADEDPKHGDVVVSKSRGRYEMGVWIGPGLFDGTYVRCIGPRRKLIGVVKNVEI